MRDSRFKSCITHMTTCSHLLRCTSPPQVSFCATELLCGWQVPALQALQLLTFTGPSPCSGLNLASSTLAFSHLVASFTAARRGCSTHTATVSPSFQAGTAYSTKFSTARKVVKGCHVLCT